jgi:hypothetical protein
MPPTIVLAESARENLMVQALATGWFATGLTTKVLIQSATV